MIVCTSSFLFSQQASSTLVGHTLPLTTAQVAFPERLHVFSEPGLWRGALWLPYRRDHGTLRGAMAVAAGNGSTRAVFAHADVVRCRGGIHTSHL